MNNRSWRGTILFTAILVVMGATVGVKLYGLGEESASARSSALPPAAATGSNGTEEGSDDGQPASAPHPSAPPAGSSGSSATGSSGSAATAVTGDAVQTPYGIVQVKVSFSGSTITAVDAVQAPDSEARSIQINQQALPMLKQEVLASQSAHIDTVSGATYTSEGYSQSVQSAIDRR